MMHYCCKVKISGNNVAEFYNKDLLYLFLDSLLEKGTADEICIVREGLDVRCDDEEIDSSHICDRIVESGNITIPTPMIPKGCGDISFNKSYTHLDDGSTVVKLSGGSKPNPNYVPPASVKESSY